MKRLKLLYLGSYSGYGVTVTQVQPFVEVDDQLAAKLLATGYFEDMAGMPATPPSATPEGTITSEQVVTKHSTRKKG